MPHQSIPSGNPAATPDSPTRAGASVSLDEILVTDGLRLRQHGLPKLDKESEALNALARAMAESPRQLIEVLLQKAMELCHADAAGLSVLEKTPDGEEVFRWTSLVGTLKDYVGGSTPRNHSPCGITLDRKSPQLFCHPARYFQYFNQLTIPIVEGLVIPLVCDNPAGTIWVVSQNENTLFNMEDARIMCSLGAFTSSALRIIQLLDAEHAARQKAEDEVARRKKVEEALRDSEEFSRRVLESSPDCIKVLDLDCHIKYMSPVGMKLMEMDDFKQCEYSDWRSLWQQADQAEVMAAIDHALAGGTGKFHAFCPTAKGTPKWWDVVITPIKSAQGCVIKLLSSSRDVTERKQAEAQQHQSIEKFRAVADSMPQMVWTSRPDGFLDYYNQRWLDYPALTLEQTQGSGWKQTQHPEDLQRTIEKWIVSLDTGEAFENEMRFWRASDRTWRWHFTRAVPLRVQGKITQWIGTCTDIQDRKVAEALLREAQAQVDASIREQLESHVLERTAELRHEIVERLRAEEELRTLSGRLLTLRDTEQRRIARDLHDSVGQLLTATTISLAAVATDSDRLRPESAKALSECVELLQETFKEVRVVSHLLHPPLLDEIGLPSALSWYLDGFAQRGKIEAELMVAQDFGRLPIELETAIFRVVQECLTNIHRHSGSKTATVKVSRLSDEVQVEVADRGKGIPDQTSHGVGLRGMTERVKQFGGRMEIRSSGVGTTVVARIPLPSAPSEE